jgi:hypothetical protein
MECEHLRVLPVERRRGNVACLEIGQPSPRCWLKPPVNTAGIPSSAIAWVGSGGSLLAFGCCDSDCPKPPAEVASIDLAALNAAAVGTWKLFESGVIRWDPAGRRWWLMNRQSDGWSSYGRMYASLAEILACWAIELVSVDRDEHGWFVSFSRWNREAE